MNNPIRNLKWVYGCLALLLLMAGSLVEAQAGAHNPVLTKVVDIPMPGPAVRFDYQSLDVKHGRLYISHMNANQLVVFDTPSRKVVANLDGFSRAFDPGLKRLYVSAESGNVAVFQESNRNLTFLGKLYMSDAHTVSVDPKTHLVYFPLQNISGHPLLRIMKPTD